MAKSLVPEFVFSKDAAKGGMPKTIEHASEVKTYIVSFRDGKGDLQVRMSFVPVGSEDSTFVIQPKIANVSVTTTAHNWFNKALRGFLAKAGVVESNPSNTAESV